MSKQYVVEFTEDSTPVQRSYAVVEAENEEEAIKTAMEENDWDSDQVEEEGYGPHVLGIVVSEEPDYTTEELQQKPVWLKTKSIIEIEITENPHNPQGRGSHVTSVKVDGSEISREDTTVGRSGAYVWELSYLSPEDDCFDLCLMENLGH